MSNLVVLVGNVTRDPELKHVGNKGTALCSFSVAWKDDRGNSHFFDCKAWGQTAEAIADSAVKGDPFTIVDGRLNQETWEAEGQKRSRVTITVWAFACGQRGAKKQAAPAASQPMEDNEPLPF